MGRDSYVEHSLLAVFNFLLSRFLSLEVGDSFNRFVGDSFNRFVDPFLKIFFGFYKFIKLEQIDPVKCQVNNFLPQLLHFDRSFVSLVKLFHI